MRYGIRRSLCRFCGRNLLTIGTLSGALPILVNRFASTGSNPLVHYGALLAYFLPWVVFSVLWRDRYLLLEQVPSLDKRARYARVSPGQDFRLSELAPIKPRFQFSMRWLMIGVAIVGLVLWSEI